MVRGILLLSGVAIMPAVMSPVCSSNVKVHDQASSGTDSCVNKLSEFVLNVLTVLVQFGYIPIALLTNYFLDDSKTDSVTYELVLFIVAMIFISFSWWENFVDDRFCGRTNQRSCWKGFVLKIKFDLQESRPIISTCTSFIKIGLTFLISWAIKSYHPENSNNMEENTKHIADVTLSEAFGTLRNLPTSEHYAIITLTISAFVGHYVGYTACKLKLQRFSYSAPLFLSTPLAVIVAIYECSGMAFLDRVSDEEKTCRMDDSVYDVWYHYLYGVFAWMSMYWLCRHIFSPTIERLAKMER